MKQKYIIFLGFYFIFANSIFSQIVNEGTLQIKSSTTVYFGDEYTNKTTATHNNDGDLYLNSNFINNGATTSTSGTTFFNSSVNSIQTISGSTSPVNFYNLEVDNSLTGVSVEDNFGLYVTNTVALNSGDLRLVGDAQLIQTNNVANSGSGKLLRDQQGVSSAYAYNYWSSPVHTAGVFKFNGGLFDGTDSANKPFSPQQVQFNSGSPYNGIPSSVDGSGNVTTPLTINDSWLYTYSPDDTGYSGWDKKTKDSPINPGEGFIMKGTNTLVETQNYVFKGTPNNGEYSFVVAVGESALLGNPYPSALNCTEFILDNMSSPPDSRTTSNTIDAALYFWVEGGSSSHNLSDYLGGYATRNLATGVPASTVPTGISGLGTPNLTAPKQHMAVSQGFFVDIIGDGNIVFKNSQRVFKTESSGESVHFKAASNTIKSTIRIGHEDPEGFHRQLALVFMPESYADLNFNSGYDAIMTSVREDDIFFIIENDLDKKYVIQGVGAYDNSYEFPLGLIITEEGEHTIMLDAVENFSETVYIKDQVLDTIYNLSAANFIPSLSPGEYLDRFKLVFKPKEVLSEDEIEDEITDKILKVYYNNNNILISNKGDLKLNNVSIFNMLGQQLINVNTNLLNEPAITIPFAYKKGIYLIVVFTYQGRTTYKIIN